MTKRLLRTFLESTAAKVKAELELVVKQPQEKTASGRRRSETTQVYTPPKLAVVLPAVGRASKVTQ